MDSVARSAKEDKRSKAMVSWVRFFMMIIEILLFIIGVAINNTALILIGCQILMLSSSLPEILMDLAEKRVIIKKKSVYTTAAFQMIAFFGIILLCVFRFDHLRNPPDKYIILGILLLSMIAAVINTILISKARKMINDIRMILKE